MPHADVQLYVAGGVRQALERPAASRSRESAGFPFDCEQRHSIQLQANFQSPYRPELMHLKGAEHPSLGEGTSCPSTPQEIDR